MAEFAILRVAKLKSYQAIKSSMLHTFREQETPNADPDRLATNSLIGASSSGEALEEFQKRLPEKIRKNGVLAIEYLITGSPEAMAAKTREQQDSYFQDSLKWLRRLHGAENVFFAAIHRDETTPHLVVYVTPKDENGKLNCRKFLGGSVALAKLQSDFADRVACNHSLYRGIPGSKAKHQQVKRYYSLINMDVPEKPPTTFLGNVRPEAYTAVKNALEAHRANSEAMRKREKRLANLESLLAEQTRNAEEEQELRIQIGYKNDILLAANNELKQRIEGLTQRFKEADEARMKYIDESRYYQSLLAEKGVDYDR